MNKTISVAVGAILIGLCGCDSHDNPGVKIILPNAYKGEFFVVVDPIGGKRAPYIDGRYVLAIPDNGVLYVKDGDFLSRWHKTTIFYVDGSDVTVRENAAAGRSQRGTSVLKTKRGDIDIGSADNTVHIYELSPP